MLIILLKTGWTAAKMGEEAYRDSVITDKDIKLVKDKNIMPPHIHVHVHVT